MSAIQEITVRIAKTIQEQQYEPLVVDITVRETCPKKKYSERLAELTVLLKEEVFLALDVGSDQNGRPEEIPADESEFIEGEEGEEGRGEEGGEYEEGQGEEGLEETGFEEGGEFEEGNGEFKEGGEVGGEYEEGGEEGGEEGDDNGFGDFFDDDQNEGEKDEFSG